MKILVVINEKLSETILGRNTTLGYVLSALEAGHEVYVLEIDAMGKLPQDEIDVWHLDQRDVKLINEYKRRNDLLGTTLGLSVEVVKDFYSLRRTSIKLSQIDFVIQRLEPMKAPFPPIGNLSIKQYLLDLKKLFPAHFIFNNPQNCFGDKELPLIIDDGTLATPTVETFFGDADMSEKIVQIAQKYQEIFKTTKQKIVIKPNNSAQTLGIFSIEFSRDCQINLTVLQEKTLQELMETQSYKIAIDPDDKSLQEVLKILCFVQFSKNHTVNYTGQIKNIPAEEISYKASSLYNDKILMQPFLEGIAQGDIRVSLAKLSDGNFHVVGSIFRKSIKHDEQNFTTCLTSGQSEANLVEDCLTVEEKNHLKETVNYILQKLNGELKEKYRECLEIGLDFILSGNTKTVYFGEANHHCPATMTVSEAVRKNSRNGFFAQVNGLPMPYNGGLGVVGEVVKQQIMLQKNS